MKHLIDKLRSNRRLDAEEYKALLLCRDTALAAYLQGLAREEALARFGNKIFIRGLIEITNRSAITATIAAYGRRTGT